MMPAGMPPTDTRTYTSGNYTTIYTETGDTIIHPRFSAPDMGFKWGVNNIVLIDNGDGTASWRNVASLDDIGADETYYFYREYTLTYDPNGIAYYPNIFWKIVASPGGTTISNVPLYKGNGDFTGLVGADASGDLNDSDTRTFALSGAQVSTNNAYDGTLTATVRGGEIHTDLLETITFAAKEFLHLLTDAADVSLRRGLDGTLFVVTDNGDGTGTLSYVADPSTLTGSDYYVVARIVVNTLANGFENITFHGAVGGEGVINGTLTTAGGKIGFEKTPAPAGAPESYTIKLADVNDAPVFGTGDAVPVTEGGAQDGTETVTLTEAMLAISDEDANDNADGETIGTMAFTVSGQQNGTIQLNGVDATTFTLDDVRAGNVSFKHDGGEQFEQTDGYPNETARATTFTLTADDGAADNNQSAPQLFELTVTPVNDAPVVTVNTGITSGLDEGGSITLTEAHLKTVDADNARAAVVYTLEVAPLDGQLRLNGAKLDAGDTFTQQDIADGNVAYAHNGSEAHADSFQFTVDDGDEDASAPLTQTFSITANAVNDVPTTVIAPQAAAAQLTPRLSLTLTATSLGTAGNRIQPQINDLGPVKSVFVQDVTVDGAVITIHVYSTSTAGKSS